MTIKKTIKLKKYIIRKNVIIKKKLIKKIPLCNLGKSREDIKKREVWHYFRVFQKNGVHKPLPLQCAPLPPMDFCSHFFFLFLTFLQNITSQ